MNSRRALSRRALSAAVLLGALAFPLLAVTPANAEDVSQSCWTDVDTAETECFDGSLDVLEQIELATGAPVVAVESGNDESRTIAIASSPRGITANYLLTTAWDGINQTGDSTSYFTTNANICNGFNYGVSTLLTWNDRIKSFQSFNGCETLLYDDINFDGDWIGPLVASNDLGTFNNRASSLSVE